MAVLAGHTAFAASLAAQSVRGVVVDQTATPVPGVVVLLLDASSVVVSRALSAENGQYRLTAVTAGAYRIKTLRIGFRPVTSESVVLRAGMELEWRVTLASVPFSLDTIQVVERSNCRFSSDSSTATFALWEQARAALTATSLTTSQRSMGATILSYERIMDPTFRHVREQTSSVRSGLTARPWRSISADSLRRSGYVVTAPDGGATYYAPDLDVLLSDVFLADHCFRLASASDASLVGIEFAPTPERARFTDIHGTLWLDRASSELRSLTFRFTGLTRPQESGRPGGSVEFARLVTGAWVITRWSIRMPALERSSQNVNAGVPGSLSEYPLRVREIRVAGGELALVTRNGDTLWAHAPIPLSGTVTDSASGLAIAGASTGLRGTQQVAISDAKGNYSIPSVLPGAYVLEAHTPSLDSLGVVHAVPVTVTDAPVTVHLRLASTDDLLRSLCGSALAASQGSLGVIAGKVFLHNDSQPARNIRVLAEWLEFWVREGTSGQHARSVETTTDPRGAFRLCGIPVNTEVTVRTALDSKDGRGHSVRIPRGARAGRIEIAVQRPVVAGATFSGRVLEDSTMLPIAGADVVLAEANLSARTNAQGEFRIAGIPASLQTAIARHVGHRPASAQLFFGRNAEVANDFVLKRQAVVLDSVVVRAAKLRTEFEERRHSGVGHFITRAELAKQEGRRMGEVMSQVQGARVVRGRGNYAWIAKSRGSLGGNSPMDRVDRGVRGAPPACYADVWLDGVRLYGSRPGESLFDVNTLSTNDIETIEYYASEAQVPVKYMRAGALCGVLVIRTRIGK